jgi:hypothetical protein
VITVATFSILPAAASASSPYNHATWWNKYQLLLNQTTLPPCGISSGNFSQGSNIDTSNEATPQSETSIAIDPGKPSVIVAGSNEIVCDPMRGYFSSNGGSKWGAVDLPLPPPLSTNGQDFGSDPGVAWDTLGNVFYSYIVVFFNRTFTGVQGSEMAVARSGDFGQTWTATFFNLNSGNGKFNDKPMIAVDTNPGSPHINTVYVAWDNASPRNGKSSDNDVVLVSSSTDHGLTFSAPVVASPSQGGPAAVIGADPFVAPDGTLFVAWQDSINPAIRESSSRDGGATFGPDHLIATTLAVFQVNPPAQALRGALIYPACGADTSASFKGRLYCSWADATTSNGMDVFVSHSTDGVNWAPAVRVNDDTTGVANDQFNQWLAVDPSNGAVVLSWNDTRNDPTRDSTDIFFAKSLNGGLSFSANVQVTNAPTNESCCGADLGNQYGDYEGISAFKGVVRAIWTDRRSSVAAVPGLDEEIFTEAFND